MTVHYFRSKYRVARTVVSLREQFLGNGDMLQKTIQLQNGVCTGKSHAGNEKQRTLSKQTLDIAMHIEVRENKRGRFRRVSKARIFDGHVLKIGVYAAAVMVTAYLIITSCISLLFSYFHDVEFPLVFWTLLPGALLGYFILVMERTLGLVKGYMFVQMGKLLTAFLLFFAHTIGYLALSSIIVSYPLGYVMEKFWGMPGMAMEYSLFSVNFFIILAIISWLRNMRTPPYRCL